MSWWWFAFGSLVVIGLFSNFGAMVAKWVSRSAQAKLEPPPEPMDAAPQFVWHWWGPGPDELRMPDGSVFLNEHTSMAEWGEHMGAWFSVEDGLYVRKDFVNEALKAFRLAEKNKAAAKDHQRRLRKYGGARA